MLKSLRIFSGLFAGLNLQQSGFAAKLHRAFFLSLIETFGLVNAGKSNDTKEAALSDSL